MDRNFTPRGPLYDNPPPRYPPAPYPCVQNDTGNPPSSNIWPAPGAGPNFPQPPPQAAPPWPSFPPPPPGQEAGGYRQPPPNLSAPAGFQRPPPPFEFDPSRPPPGYCAPEPNQVSALIEAQRTTTNVMPQCSEFESKGDGTMGHLAPGPSTGFQNNTGGSVPLEAHRNFPSTKLEHTGPGYNMEYKGYQRKCIMTEHWGPSPITGFQKNTVGSLPFQQSGDVTSTDSEQIGPMHNTENKGYQRNFSMTRPLGPRPDTFQNWGGVSMPFETPKNVHGTEMGQFGPIHNIQAKGYQSNFNIFRGIPLVQPLEKLDEEHQQREQDEKWLQNFLSRRTQRLRPHKKLHVLPNVRQIREDLYSAVKLVSELSLICQTLKKNLENDAVWSESYNQAIGLKRSIQGKLTCLSDSEVMENLKNKLVAIRKKRIRAQRQKIHRYRKEQKREQQLAEQHAAIDKWRLKRSQEVEEKNREKELKRAADAVLAEVRKKQGDAKKMLDVLKALEKLRKLRKEAAARKGVFPERESDEVFEGHLFRLRALIAKRTAVYNDEEKALSVMLEGEQEEERKRDIERRQKRERERLLQKKQQIEAMLFGGEVLANPLLGPFQEFQLQAERSMPALLMIRREWDQYLVSAEHPDGSAVPQAWVLPEHPADEAWASALLEHVTL